MNKGVGVYLTTDAMVLICQKLFWSVKLALLPEKMKHYQKMSPTLTSLL